MNGRAAGAWRAGLSVVDVDVYWVRGWASGLWGGRTEEVVVVVVEPQVGHLYMNSSILAQVHNAFPTLSVARAAVLSSGGS